jgi:hypothetical protein
LKRTDAWPIFNRIDQIGRGRIGEGVGHLIKECGWAATLPTIRTMPFMPR